MLLKLINSIRSNDAVAFKAILSTQEGIKAINETFTLNAQDIHELQGCNQHANKLRGLGIIPDCRPIFLTILYNRLDFFHALIEHRALLDVSMSGINLMTFSLCHNSIDYVAVLIDAHHAHKTTFRQGTNMWTSAPAEDDSELSYFIRAAKKGHTALLQRYIMRKVHLQDTQSDALFEALAHGKTACVMQLKDAPVKIFSRHYYAAGLAENNSMEMFSKLSSQYSSTQKEAPEFINMGDLKELQKNMSTDTTQLSHWLYQAIMHDRVACVIFLLCNGVSIEPKHYFAAGRVAKSDVFESTCFHTLLNGVDTGEYKRDMLKIVDKFPTQEQWTEGMKTIAYHQ